MTRRLRWTTRATDQLIEAGAYLENQRPGAGLQLVALVEKALDVTTQSPFRFPRVPGFEDSEIRRALIRRFGHWVIYEVHADVIVVLAIWHGARDPDAWRDDE